MQEKILTEKELKDCIQSKINTRNELKDEAKRISLSLIHQIESISESIKIIEIEIRDMSNALIKLKTDEYRSVTFD